MIKEFKRPEGYTCPFYTSKEVARLLDLNVATVLKKKDKMATEIIPGTFYWSEEDIKKLIESSPTQGRKDIYKDSIYYKRKMANKNNIDEQN